MQRHHDLDILFWPEHIAHGSWQLNVNERAGSDCIQMFVQVLLCRCHSAYSIKAPKCDEIVAHAHSWKRVVPYHQCHFGTVRPDL